MWEFNLSQRMYNKSSFHPFMCSTVYFPDTPKPKLHLISLVEGYFSLDTAPVHPILVSSDINFICD